MRITFEPATSAPRMWLPVTTTSWSWVPSSTGGADGTDCAWATATLACWTRIPMHAARKQVATSLTKTLCSSARSGRQATPRDQTVAPQRFKLVALPIDVLPHVRLYGLEPWVIV